MGAWGVNTFDNDAACDWKYGLEDVDNLSLVCETLTCVLAVGSEYLDSNDACEGLAACEVIARLKGNWGVRDAYTESLDKWVEAHPIQPPTDLVNQALAVIARVLTAPSELTELWDAEGENKEWHDAVEDLCSRVAA
jgi:hypothetical protein